MMPAPPTSDAAALYAQALAERLHTPSRLHAHAQALQALAGERPAWQARAQVLTGWAETFEGRLDAARARAGLALQTLLEHGDLAGSADARDLLARHAIATGDLAQANHLLDTNLALPADTRSPLAWSITFMRRAVALECAGAFDDALRWYYRSLAQARRAAHPTEEALALASAGGLQVSLHNVEDGATLLEAAWRLVHPAHQAWRYLWPLVAVNRLMALHLLHRTDEALQTLPVVLEGLPGLVPTNRYKALLLMGSICVEAGQLERGQALLDEGLAQTPAQAGRSVVWVWAQACAWTRRGRAAEALAICNAHLDDAAAGRLAQADTPADLLRLHRARADACEALGDHAAALAAERATLAAERELAGAAARAQRLTLQIRFELEEAERARADAERQARHALAERTRLAELNTALEAADRAKSRFLAAASHDLRQPVHALTLQLALLRTMLPAAEQQAQAGRMQASLEALKAMFDALLDISRIDTGVVQPQWQTVALRPLCARLVEEFAPAAEARGLRVALRLKGPASTRSDPALLETLLRNLLDNAVKYTARGGVLLALRARPGGGWRLQVRDTGPGIAPADQPRAFEEFVQLAVPATNAAPTACAVPGGAPASQDSPTSGASAGLGLGLSIVRRLARLLEHPLALRSRTGRGCLFEVTLPALPHEPGPSTRPAPCLPGGAAAVSAQGARPLRVAVIEDHGPTRTALAGLLSLWGHDVVAAGDAAGIRSRASPPDAKWDCVISDLRLAGGLDGLAEARELAGREHSPRVLVVTAETDPAQWRRLAEGGVSWMTKPLDPARLATWLAQEFALRAEAGAEGQSRQILEAR